MIDEERAKNLRTIYEQYWLHARHVENERLWFTNIYAVVWAGSLAFMYEFGIQIQLIVFLFTLSLLGLLMCHALRVPFIQHSRLTEIILREEWKLEKYSTFYARETTQDDETHESGEAKNKLLGLSTIFYLIYSVGMIASSAILLYEVNWYIWIKIVVGIFVIAILISVNCWFKKIENKLHRELGQMTSSGSKTT